ncbi:hypothetical protein [Planktotalea sp.]|uniref:hypothetical protein n=1 Tax=Planktotalea sp. TaxID=2029877 RepID=UPI003D6BB6DF
MRKLSILFVAAFLAVPAYAEPPKVVKAVAHSTGMGWNFDVTLEHPDTGWDHYADGWEIVTGDGEILGTRILHHPHVEEQPFTRTLRHVMVPDGTREVFLRVKCSADGWKDSGYKVTLER